MATLVDTAGSEPRSRPPVPTRSSGTGEGVLAVLDAVYTLGAVGLFALLGLLVRALEKL